MKAKKKWTKSERDVIISNMVASKNEQSELLDKVADILDRGVGGVRLKRDRISRRIGFDDGLYSKATIGGAETEL